MSGQRVIYHRICGGQMRVARKGRAKFGFFMLLNDGGECSGLAFKLLLVVGLVQAGDVRGACD